ncbi:MAG: T9SS type A sorting domain-containing protein, partial [Bacteroidia bacterium]|nr:T9SS type A sorting domain-containing protein [Bacteroidia bacterium]NNM15391.1 T9SS type A sorting domain-containing protein [Bacteroidia bacterium]
QQGGIPVINELFKATRYAPDYAGFTNQILTPGNPVELNPFISNCTIYSGIDNPANQNGLISINSIIQNSQIQLKNNTNIDLKITVYDLSGKLLLNSNCTDFQCTFDAQNLKKGIYLINIFNLNKNIQIQSKIIKL